MSVYHKVELIWKNFSTTSQLMVKWLYDTYLHIMFIICAQKKYTIHNKHSLQR